MQRLFYATAEDLLLVCDRIEDRRRLAYTLIGMFTSPELSTVYSGADISTLRSPAPDPSAMNGYSYLVTDRDRPIAIRKAPQEDGGIRYAVDQLENPDSVTLCPGAVLPPNVLLHGRVGTVSTTPSSSQLHRAFASAIGKTFQKVQAYYVGPGSIKLWHSGHRLTIGAKSPTTYDLAA
jgi:hypothetical protein